MNFGFKNGSKNEFEDKTKNHAADPEIGFLTKSISKANGYATAMPPAWELRIAPLGRQFCNILKILQRNCRMYKIGAQDLRLCNKLQNL